MKKEIDEQHADESAGKNKPGACVGGGLSHENRVRQEKNERANIRPGRANEKGGRPW